jgi:hypothetical protein
LIELLLLIVVFVVVMGVLVPGCQRVRDDGWRMETFNNLGQVAKAAHNAHDSNKKFPPYYGAYGTARTPLTFHAHLLQYVDQPTVYKQLIGDTSVANPSTNPSLAIVPAYVSSKDPTLTSGGAGACNFPVNIRLYYTAGGTGTLSPPDNPRYPKMPNSFPDGTSNTLLLATKYMQCGNGGSLWMDPGKNAADSPTAAAFGFSMGMWQKAPSQAACNPVAGTAVSFTRPNIQVALCDASVRSVAADISPATWQAVHTPGAGDNIGADWDN